MASTLALEAYFSFTVLLPGTPLLLSPLDGVSYAHVSVTFALDRTERTTRAYK